MDCLLRPLLASCRKSSILFIVDRANIVIIGGGVVGCAIARAASKRWSEVFLVEQFRLPPLYAGCSPWQIEAVAGLVDTEESYEAVARREIREEAGLVPIGDLIDNGLIQESERRPAGYSALWWN